MDFKLKARDILFLIIVWINVRILINKIYIKKIAKDKTSSSKTLALSLDWVR